ncbi:UPF0157-domain-containing protein [Thozetella sp. PMI_491]|nr:UPF0157-domain-containing protein [Thozetella sp. PMI_491]
MPSAAEIRKLTEYLDVLPEDVQRVSTRPRRRIEIAEPDPTWPAQFAVIASKVRAALGDTALSVEHVGSTSVPGLPAKPIIDVDIVIADPAAEDAYVPALEAAGFQFLHREPKWHDHRFFGLQEPYANVHVFGPDCPETTRHIMFRDWLKAHPDDFAKYVAAKRAAATVSEAAGETTDEYNMRKHDTIQEIYGRIFRAHGYVLDQAEEGQE